MRNSFKILFIFGVLLNSIQAYCVEVKEKETENSIISREYLDIIEHSDSIIWYILDPISEDTTVIRLNEQWEILLCKADTLIERSNALKNTLTYPSSFIKNNIVKECTFLPDIAICLYSRDSVVTFLYSFYCDLCRFERKGKYQETDGEFVRKTIIQMASEVFPEDRYLRQLNRKKK